MEKGGIAPERVERVGETALKVLWRDGHESLYGFDLLRAACPCALCRQLPGQAGEKAAPPKGPAVKPVQIQPVGRYAMTIQWGDGHTTGIFSHEYLRSLCPCEGCKPEQFTEG